MSFEKLSGKKIKIKKFLKIIWNMEGSHKEKWQQVFNFNLMLLIYDESGRLLAISSDSLLDTLVALSYFPNRHDLLDA